MYLNHNIICVKKMGNLYEPNWACITLIEFNAY